MAAADGRVDIVQYLLAAGATPDAMTKERVSPILAAATKGHVTVVEALITHGADVDAAALVTE